jgi:hypothetical protein
MNYLLSILFLIVFLGGLYFYAKYGTPKLLEGLTNNSEIRCPDILVQKGSKYFLYNSKIAKVPGVNPVEFQNLEDYVEFLQWQRGQGIRCPVLFLQHTYDAQGESVYKMRPSPTDLQCGLPPNIPYKNQLDLAGWPSPTLLVDATRDDKPYNQNTAPGFDASSYYQGSTTPLDMMNKQQENLLVSPDPMDPNWGGPEYTDKLVDAGYYKGNEVNILVA